MRPLAAAPSYSFAQALDDVDGILTAQGSVDGVRSDQSVEEQAAKLLQDKQVAL